VRALVWKRVVGVSIYRWGSKSICLGEVCGKMWLNRITRPVEPVSTKKEPGSSGRFNQGFLESILEKTS
jgi:hypothetical protein